MIYGFMHVALMNNGYEIFNEQVYKIKRSQLYEKCDKIFIGCVHNQNSSISYFENIPDKFELVIDKSNLKEYEIPTLNYLIEFCNNINSNCKLFYIHTKGASKNHIKHNTYWRKSMEYYNIIKHQDCIDQLENHDTCGIKWTIDSENNSYYSGNFWWANSNYIKTCKPLITDKSKLEDSKYRLQAELFIGSNKPNYKDFLKTKFG